MNDERIKELKELVEVIEMHIEDARLNLKPVIAQINLAKELIENLKKELDGLEGG